MRENSIVFLKIIFSSSFVFPRCYIPYTHRTNNIYHPESQSEKSRLSGNAGLFSTADDLAIFARMMLNRGEHKGVRILSPVTVARMTSVWEKAS